LAFSFSDYLVDRLIGNGAGGFRATFATTSASAATPATASIALLATIVDRCIGFDLAAC
jgi:hypothetical protein